MSKGLILFIGSGKKKRGLAYTCNLNTWEMEVRESEVEDHSQLYNTFGRSELHDSVFKNQILIQSLQFVCRFSADPITLWFSIRFITKF